jgi:hypothetical protein
MDLEALVVSRFKLVSIGIRQHQLDYFESTRYRGTVRLRGERLPWSLTCKGKRCAAASQ